MNIGKKLTFSARAFGLKGLDFYTTDPKSLDLFWASFKEKEDIKQVWEPACGNGDISEGLKNKGVEVFSSDIVKRDYECKEIDFLGDFRQDWPGDIITNPPYNKALEFTTKALKVVKPGRYVIFHVRMQFLESKKRRPLFEKNIHSVYLHSQRVGCYKEGDRNINVKGIPYIWTVFKKDYEGDVKFYWI